MPAAKPGDPLRLLQVRQIVAQGIVHQFAFRDVLKNAEQAIDPAVLVDQRQLGGVQPAPFDPGR